jgi:hypothetical protein
MLRLSVLLSSALTAFFLLAQPSGTDKLIQNFVRAYNEGDAAMRAYLEKHSTTEVPIPERMERYRLNKSNFASLKIETTESDSNTAAEARLTAPDGRRLTMMFRFELGAEPKIVGYGIRLGHGPGKKGAGPGGPGLKKKGGGLPKSAETAAPAGATLKEPEALREIAAAIDRRFKAEEFSRLRAGGPRGRGAAREIGRVPEQERPGTQSPGHALQHRVDHQARDQVLRCPAVGGQETFAR